MDSSMRSRLLHHLSCNQNTRRVPYTHRSSSLQESYPSPSSILPALYDATSPCFTNTRTSSLSPVYTEYPQMPLYVGTDSLAQDLSIPNAWLRVAPVGLPKKAPSLQIPTNPHSHGQVNRTVQAVDENNNIINADEPALVSSPVWRPW